LRAGAALVVGGGAIELDCPSGLAFWHVAGPSSARHSIAAQTQIDLQNAAMFQPVYCGRPYSEAKSRQERAGDRKVLAF